MDQKKNESMSENFIEISKEHFARVQNLTHLGSWKIYPETGVVEATKEARKIYGVGDKILTLPFIQSIPVPECREALDLELRNLLAGISSYDIEYQIKRFDNGEIRAIHSIAEYDPVEKCMTGTLQDITEKMMAEHALADSEQRYRAIFDNSVSGIIYIGLDGRILEINQKMLDLLGSPSPEETKGINMLTFPLLVRAGFSANLEEVIRLAIHKSGSTKYESKWGVTRYLEYDLTPIKSGCNLVGVIGKIEDITERKAAESRIEALLKEKDIILREVHHRIKNNMSSIESLLRLQVESSQNTEVMTELKDAIARISSMRVLYEKLYQSEDFMETSSKVYLSKLIDDIAEVFPESDDITIEKQINDFMIPSDVIFALGIIINELVTNAMKYAFVEKNDNMFIRIFAKREDATISIIVRDNGSGYKESGGKSFSDGFGLQLIRMLSEQIGGRAEFYNDDGAVFSIEFKV